MKTRLLMCFVVAAAFTVQQATAQNFIVIEDFEDPDQITIPLNNMTGGNVPDDEAFEVVENPSPDEVNSTDNVLRFLRAHDGVPWGGFWSNVFEPLDMDGDMKYTHYQVWKPRISPVRFKIEGSDETPDFEHESMEEQTIVNGWETMTFYYPDAAGEYPVIVVMPDFADPVNLDENIVIYLDNIILSDSPDDPTAISIEQGELPVHLALKQNYPNPFNPATTISFELKNADNVTLNVYNVQGQLVTTLVDGQLAAGEHQVVFNAEGLSSGIYFYRLQTTGRTITRYMTLAK